MPPEFVHLHVHSDYSLLDGMGKVRDYVALARGHGMNALAITDHGVMYGAVDLYTEATDAGLKPIVGCEMYVAPRSLRDKAGRQDADYAHLILLARNIAGYRNLMQLVTTAHLDGYYYKPRIDHELLASHSEGLIALSSCIGGEVPKLLLQGQEREARQVADKYRSILGAENYFIELQDHPFDEQARANRELVRLAHDMGIPLVATADVHYPRAEDAEIQDILLCIQTGRMVDEPNRMRMSSSTNYMRSPAEMAAAFAELPEAIANTVRVAEMCDLQIPMGQWILPQFDVPAGITPQRYLRQLCEAGLGRRYATVTTEVRQRLDYELEVIEQKGYTAYFLIVQDFVNWARDRGIAVTSRGSAAGSLVSFLLNITSADPLLYKLPFERFLNPYRPSPPDIDMDFEDSRREEVIQYVTEKYGEDRVAQIITFGTMEARAAVRDVGRVLGVSYGECDTLAKLIQPNTSIAESLESSMALKQMYESSPQTKRVLDVAARLEGVTRHASTHAAGVIIARDPLTQHAPLQRESSGTKLLIQYGMRQAEAVGLMKMDFLGLANLSILGRAVETIRVSRGEEIVLDELPLDDAATYQLLSSGETTGIFQLESAGMRRYIKELKPTDIRDVAAMISLYRPGPMDNIPEYIARKHGTKPVQYLVPQLEPLLKDSYGVLVYQDDILLISIQLAGYTWEEADKLRKAVGKKDKAVLDAQQDKFVKGCQRHGGLSTRDASALWEWMVPFARYGFNKAHAAAYALVAYQTAYLKANYPSEYMSSFLTVSMGNAEKIAAGILECRRMGIEVLPPDVNSSFEGFRLEPRPGREEAATPVRFGLGAIKNVGAGPIQAVLEARGKVAAQKFRSLEHLCQLVDTRVVNRRVLESLVKAGALDSLGSRSQLLAAVDDALSLAQRTQRASGAGQLGLFEGASSKEEYVPTLILPAVAPAAREEQLAWEKELLGIYLTAHPLAAALDRGPRSDVTLLTDLGRDSIGQVVSLVGMLTNARVMTTKKKQEMLVGRLEDLTSGFDFVAFPQAYEQYRGVLRDDAILEVTAKLDERGDRLQLICESARLYAPHDAYGGEGETGREAPALPATPPAAPEPPKERRLELRLRLDLGPDHDDNIRRMSSVERVLRAHPGPDAVTVQLGLGPRAIVLEPQALSVYISSELEQALEIAMGRRSWRVIERESDRGTDRVA